MIEETNKWDVLCNFFIFVMQYLSTMTGLSYGLINILLFVILGPLSTLTSLVSAIIACVKGRNKYSIILLVICFLIILAIIIPPIRSLADMIANMECYEPAE